MWGVIPAAGNGTRIQPLAFSKELLPVGSRIEDGVERPKAVSEYLVERLMLGGASNGFWRARGEREEYVGTLINAWLEQGGQAWGVRAGKSYVDVGTLHGYREAIRLLSTGRRAARLPEMPGVRGVPAELSRRISRDGMRGTR